jgi:hypothetical protein
VVFQHQVSVVPLTDHLNNVAKRVAKAAEAADVAVQHDLFKPIILSGKITHVGAKESKTRGWAHMESKPGLEDVEIPPYVNPAVKLSLNDKVTVTVIELKQGTNSTHSRRSQTHSVVKYRVTCILESRCVLREEDCLEMKQRDKAFGYFSQAESSRRDRGQKEDECLIAEYECRIACTKLHDNVN